MTAVTEAIVLPFAFLTITLLGGLEFSAGGAAWSGPSLFSLVLALLLIGALVRSGTLSPDRLLHTSRSSLANANGAVLLVSVFAAAAQVFHMLTPREGLPLLLVGLLLFVLLVNALAATPDRVSLLRSVAIGTGSAFVLKFVVLTAFADAEGSRTKRVILALFDVATFGTIAQAPLHPAAGYLAFFVTLMFLIAVSVLPSALHTTEPYQTTEIARREL